MLIWCVLGARRCALTPPHVRSSRLRRPPPPHITHTRDRRHSRREGKGRRNRLRLRRHPPLPPPRSDTSSSRMSSSLIGACGEGCFGWRVLCCLLFNSTVRDGWVHMRVTTPPPRSPSLSSVHYPFPLSSDEGHPTLPQQNRLVRRLRRELSAFKALAGLAPGAPALMPGGASPEARSALASGVMGLQRENAALRRATQEASEREHGLTVRLQAAQENAGKPPPAEGVDASSGANAALEQLRAASRAEVTRLRAEVATLKAALADATADVAAGAAALQQQQLVARNRTVGVDGVEGAGGVGGAATAAADATHDAAELWSLREANEALRRRVADLARQLSLGGSSTRGGSSSSARQLQSSRGNVQRVGGGFVANSSNSSRSNSPASSRSASPAGGSRPSAALRGTYPRAPPPPAPQVVSRVRGRSPATSRSVTPVRTGSGGGWVGGRYASPTTTLRASATLGPPPSASPRGASPLLRARSSGGVRSGSGDFSRRERSASPATSRASSRGGVGGGGTTRSVPLVAQRGRSPGGTPSPGVRGGLRSSSPLTNSSPAGSVGSRGGSIGRSPRTDSRLPPPRLPPSPYLSSAIRGGWGSSISDGVSLVPSRAAAAAATAAALGGPSPARRVQRSGSSPSLTAVTSIYSAPTSPSKRGVGVSSPSSRGESAASTLLTVSGGGVDLNSDPFPPPVVRQPWLVADGGVGADSISAPPSGAAAVAVAAATVATRSPLSNTASAWLERNSGSNSVVTLGVQQALVMLQRQELRSSLQATGEDGASGTATANGRVATPVVALAAQAAMPAAVAAPPAVSAPLLPASAAGAAVTAARLLASGGAASEDTEMAAIDSRLSQLQEFLKRAKESV